MTLAWRSASGHMQAASEEKEKMCSAGYAAVNTPIVHSLKFAWRGVADTYVPLANDCPVF